jgi:hypothetical protein
MGQGRAAAMRAALFALMIIRLQLEDMEEL